MLLEADLDEMLIAIHDLATHESAYQNKELNKLLAELWTIFGGNKNLDKHRHTAVSQIQTTLYSLTSFQLDMEELREQVSRLSIIEMPVEVHIESIGKGIERLRNSKVALKSGGDTKISKLIDSSNENNDNNNTYVLNCGF
ncbi:22682_t:CDS:2 [Rhizophagus irregularis]|nr:22682_t:CDS:2 [Rhizophagus irregularis]